MLYGLGIILLMLGVSAGDSDNLIIPVVLIAIGMGLIWFGGGFTDDEETRI